VQRHRKRAHAELKWVPNEITVEVSFTLIGKGGGEGGAMQQNCIGLPGVSLVSCVPNVGRGDGSQVGRKQVRATGRAKIVILEVGAEPTDNLEFAAGNRHVVRYEGLGGMFTGSNGEEGHDEASISHYSP